MAKVEIDTLPEATGNISLEIELHLTPAQAHKLCSIRCALEAAGEKLEGSDAAITTPADAVKCLIEHARRGTP